MDSETEELLNLIGCKAQNLHRSRHLHCSEAVLLVLNKALGGGLSQKKHQRVKKSKPKAAPKAVKIKLRKKKKS